MNRNTSLKVLFFATFSLLLLYGTYNFANHFLNSSRYGTIMTRESVVKAISGQVHLNQFPTEKLIDLNGHPTMVQIEYTFDEDLQKYSEKLFQQYHPDYGALLVMDAKSGKILTMISYSRHPNDLGHLALRSSFPAASIFKVVTAAAAIDRYMLSPEMIIPFNGRMHTLYKRSVLQDQTNRWTTRLTLKDAFARSVNPFFAKLGLRYLDPLDLQEYAQRFQFDQTIPIDLPMERSTASIPQNNPWGIAEAASGFNRSNTMSPLQGALMAASISNDGSMMAPFAIQSIEEQESGNLLYKTEPEQVVLTVQPSSAADLRTLMRATVTQGTSRKFFRDMLRDRRYRDLEIGGKTGSLSGDNPRGKYDWFIGFARGRGQNLAIAALTINKVEWRVKSSYLAKAVLQNYFSRLALHDLTKN